MVKTLPYIWVASHRVSHIGVSLYSGNTYIGPSFCLTLSNALLVTLSLRSLPATLCLCRAFIRRFLYGGSVIQRILYMSWEQIGFIYMYMWDRLSSGSSLQGGLLGAGSAIQGTPFIGDPLYRGSPTQGGYLGAPMYGALYIYIYIYIYSYVHYMYTFTYTYMEDPPSRREALGVSMSPRKATYPTGVPHTGAPRGTSRYRGFDCPCR